MLAGWLKTIEFARSKHMIESELAKKWASLPDYPKRLGGWTWFKSAVSECLMCSAQRLNLQCELRTGDLADAFFDWASYADNTQNFSKVDPIDYAHFACGLLLKSLMQSHPVTVTSTTDSANAGEMSLFETMNWPEDLVFLCLTLTILEGWRLHLGAEALHVDKELVRSHWNSFHENAREDAFSPIAFLDLFLGLPPVWENSMTPGNRPAMRAAFERSAVVPSA